MSLAIVAFFAGLVRFIWSIKEGEAKKADEGKKFMLWSLLAIFIIFSLYGIIYFMQQTLGIKDVTTIAKPCLNFVTDCTKTSTGLTPTNQSIDPQSEVSDDCAKSPGKQVGASCTLPNGSVGVCSNAFGPVLCTVKAVSSVNVNQASLDACSGKGERSPCTFRDDDRRTISGGCAYNANRTALFCAGGTAPVSVQDDANCSTQNESCTDNGGTKGTCDSNLYGGFYCKVPSTGISNGETCYGKSLWANCSFNGDAGKCYAQGGAQLYCAIGAEELKERSYCNPEAHNNKFCGPGLTCSQAGLTGGNQLYSCQQDVSKL